MTDFYNILRDLLNASEDAKFPMRWTESSYANDACGSVMLDIDEEGETYVQMFAFETAEEAAAEDLKQYSITTFMNGEPNYTAWEGDNYEDALSAAVEYANYIWENHAPSKKDEGFDYGGIWITDRTKTPCGRIDLTEEESVQMYGHPKLQPAQELVKMPITSEEEAREFIFALARAGLMFHWDDPADDCLAEYGFPKDVLDGIQSQVNKLFDVCEDPFEYAIDAFHEADPNGEKDISEMNNG